MVDSCVCVCVCVCGYVEGYRIESPWKNCYCLQLLICYRLSLLLLLSLFYSITIIIIVTSLHYNCSLLLLLLSLLKYLLLKNSFAYQRSANHNLQISLSRHVSNCWFTTIKFYVGIFTAYLRNSPGLNNSLKIINKSRAKRSCTLHAATALLIHILYKMTLRNVAQLSKTHFLEVYIKRCYCNSQLKSSHLRHDGITGCRKRKRVTPELPNMAHI